MSSIEIQNSSAQNKLVGLAQRTLGFGRFEFDSRIAGSSKDNRTKLVSIRLYLEDGEEKAFSLYMLK